MRKYQYSSVSVDQTLIYEKCIAELSSDTIFHRVQLYQAITRSKALLTSLTGPTKLCVTAFSTLLIEKKGHRCNPCLFESMLLMK